jgi:hypothetical protein
VKITTSEKEAKTCKIDGLNGQLCPVLPPSSEIYYQPNIWVLPT